jgi:8-oxo-dGTP pyrophosphatase MutT (NUDIX family)
VTAERPLYERDPDAWRAHLAEGNAKQARKRVSGDLLMRDGGGNILLVDPVYKPGWDLPGGMAEANESPLTATLREISEELGFTASAGRMLCVDWVPPHGPWDDLLAFIFDGGTLNKAQISSLRLADGELRAFEFCDEREARGRLRPRAWRRAAAALEALVTGNVLYLQDGHPVS